MVAEAVSKRKKKSSEQTNQIDDLLIEIWEKRFADQDAQIAELTRSLRGFNGTPGVMERLASMETRLSNTETIAKEINSKIEQLLNQPKTAPAEAKQKPDDNKTDDDKPLTKNQLSGMVVKFMGPVATAVIIWALLTFFPSVMAHVFPRP